MSDNVSGDLKQGKVSICIVNYKTEKLTRLCLRSIKKHTIYPYEVIVVDNDSQDASLEYLRSLNNIKLIERKMTPDKTGGWAHGTALDMGFDATETEYFLVMHSDTVVHKRGWLTELVAHMEADKKIACVGGGKLDLKSKWRVLLKKYDVKAWLKSLQKQTKRDDFYIRTICALYKTETLRNEKLSFILKMDEGVTCGKQLYYELIDRGYKTDILSPYQMASYIHHLAHATMVLNPEFKVRKKTEKQCKHALTKLFNSQSIQEILNDSSLDL